MSIRIITDSAADIPQNYDEKILVLPLHISFEEEEYLDFMKEKSMQIFLIL